MRIDKAVIRQMKLIFKTGFRTSFGNSVVKDFLLVELTDPEGRTGWGECSAFMRPWYNEETTVGARYVIGEFLLPALLRAEEVESPEKFYDASSWIRRNRMARSAVDCALWDLWSREQGVPEWKALGGVRTEIESGVSLGIEPSPEQLLRKIEKYRAEGYRRVKCKIKPGFDIAYLEAVRREFGDIVLMADANSAYTLKDLDLFRRMDELGLLMIEQPLACDDIVDHAQLQAAIRTPVCLDESIDSTETARRAIELGSCRIINIKVARVGGLTEARRLQALSAVHGVGCWCGGMVDAGVARGHNIAAATLPNYVYPNDIPSSDRYYAEDIVTPSTFIDRNAKIQVPQRPGTGFEPAWDVIERHTVRTWEFTRESVRESAS
ncbi:o-succinylbenzoate synthase [Mesosutterella sp. OilRF-GAM-744-9]|uniref:o-succinylbenzoate synthase n=1 Tax=Mesosutterella porci TaxID=2915351 RepID=A0ABS9MMJ7_9BURK|nr:o-succinylbenzoate synthase [Mesosutterella sp. oilRF-744-WT-GAM-9]MCG5029845.1 o-succinylbenzoate synthase [Mesosutterella sp. oilRF-744-WT-GAM-9]